MPWNQKKYTLKYTEKELLKVSRYNRSVIEAFRPYFARQNGHVTTSTLSRQQLKNIAVKACFKTMPSMGWSCLILLIWSGLV